MPKNQIRVLVLSALMAGLLAACGGEGGEKKAATQVAAKVNKEEISVHQINQVLQRTNITNPDQVKAASKQILEKLIDQELLVQQAVEKKLDRDPKTLQAIEAAKREILANAYLEQAAGNQSKPGEADIKAYYDQHPELFAERRVYNLREIAVQIGKDKLPELQNAMRDAKSMQDVVEWLKAQNLRFGANVSTKTAEQIPLELVKALHSMKDGQVRVVGAPGGVMIVEIAGSQTRPVDEKTAAPMIERFLTTQRRAEAAKAELKTLRDKAKIDYLGEFTAPAAAAPVAPNEPAVPAAPAADSAASASADGANIDKGLSGLK